MSLKNLVLNRAEKKTALYFLISLIIVWILLFELILPANNVFPKPSIVIQSFPDLIKNYDLGWNYLSTFTSVYFPLVIGYYLVRILFPFFRNLKFLSDIVSSLEWFSKLIPGIILAFIFVYWFPRSEITKYVFSFLITFSSLSYYSVKMSKKIGDKYSLAMESFGVGKNFISKNVVWKAIQPDVMKLIISKNVYFWASIVVFEYFNLGFGIGTIFRKILEFKDLSALVMMFIVIEATLFITTESLKLIKQKFYYWKS